MTSRLTARALGAAGLALLTPLALSSCTPATQSAVAPAPVAPTGALNAEEARFVDLLNAERAAHGLAPVAVHLGAVNVARGWAGQLASRGSLAHNPNLAADVEGNVTTAWLRIGENVGTGGDADSVHQAFLASPSHRANMLHPDHDLVGVGVVRTGGTLWMSMVLVAI